jgi:hypothetical protein
MQKSLNVTSQQIIKSETACEWTAGVSPAEVRRFDEEAVLAHVVRFPRTLSY